MRFAYPWLLLLLTAVPLLGAAWFWMARQGRRNLGRLVSPALQPRLMPPRSELRFHAQLALVVAGLLLLVVAAARPQWGTRTERVITRSRNLVIALDVSRSMLARDVHPNRLERAKVDIMDLIGELKGDRAALLAFRRRGILLCPLTTDYAFLRQALDGVGIDSAPRGETDLADAIRKALDALAPAQDGHNAILLISDGDDLAGNALEAAREARARNVPIFTVGIGDTTGAAVPDEAGTGTLVYHGESVRSRLSEDTLAAIARESGGRYVPLGTASTVQTTLGSIFRQHLRQIAAREQHESLERRRIERFQWFLFPALGLLLAAGFLSRGRLSGRRIQPPPLPPSAQGAARVVAVAAAILAAGTLSAATNAIPAQPPATAAGDTNAPAVPPGRAGAREAQGLERRGRHREAAAAYVAAARGADAEESQTYLFNAALALHRAGAEAEAVRLLQPLVFSPRVGDRAAELLGLAAFRSAAVATTNETNAAQARVQSMEEAGAAFQQALRARPEAASRRRNLARVDQQLPALREEARIARLLQQHEKTPPDQLIATMLQEQRALLREAPAAFTNEAPEQIRQLEALADRQERNADLWVPLKRAVLQSPALTNEQQRAVFAQLVESTRDTMGAAAGHLRDLDPASGTEIARAEPPVYNFWRGMAPPPPLLDEDIALQSNAVVRADQPLFPFRQDQPEALELTRAFVQRFPAWADQVQQAAKADTNAPSLKPEDRAEIERLSAETTRLQQRVLAPETLPSARVTHQQQALKNLLRIRELLPKQKQPQPQPQEQPPPPPQQQPQPQEQPQEQPEPQPQPDENKTETREPPPKNVQELLQRALQREKEHEAEKRRQMDRIPMLPNERDW
jgi:Ca-activated chloride channel family protein